MFQDLDRVYNGRTAQQRMRSQPESRCLPVYIPRSPKCTITGERYVTVTQGSRAASTTPLGFPGCTSSTAYDFCDALPCDLNSAQLRSTCEDEVKGEFEEQTWSTSTEQSCNSRLSGSVAIESPDGKTGAEKIAPQTLLCSFCLFIPYKLAVVAEDMVRNDQWRRREDSSNLYFRTA